MVQFDPSTHSYGSIKKIGKTGAKVHVGKFCSIADNVTALMTGHDTKNISTYPFHQVLGFNTTGHPIHYGDINIFHDVWIGHSATLKGGIAIGSGAVIAANSFVVDNVPAYAMYGGNPAKFIKYRFSRSERQFLLKLQWWDWPIEKIEENAQLLSSSDIIELQVKEYVDSQKV